MTDHGARPSISERRDLEALQATAREAAETATLLKEKFLALLSHELRTPLNPILGYARMLQSNVIAPETRRLAAETIERNALALNRLIEDLLDFSRITSGNVRLETQPVPVMTPFREALASVKPALEAKRIGIEIGGESLGTLVNGDRHRLRQIFWNVLSNAAKFTPEGGRVDATLELENTFVCVVVRDSGIGISREFMPRVFEPFRQADRQFSRQFSGLGLGLSICKHLVELHGGTISAASGGADCGTTIRLLFPAYGSPAIAGEARPAAEIGQAFPSPAEWPNPNSLSGVDALVVDDDQDMLEFLRQLLECAGASVRTAAAADAALREWDNRMPNVLVTDLGLRGIDGYALLRQLRARPTEKAQPTPAVAVSPFARLDDSAAAKAAGFDYHTSKPIDADAFIAALIALVRRDL